MTDEKEYLLKEYDKLNTEVANLLEETRSREKFSLTVIALISAWIYNAAYKDDLLKPNMLLIALSWIPLITTTLFALSVLLLYKNIQWVGLYIQKIEDQFLGDFNDKDGQLMGWEKFFVRKNKKRNFVRLSIVLWIVQIILAILVILVTPKVI